MAVASRQMRLKHGKSSLNKFAEIPTKFMPSLVDAPREGAGYGVPASPFLSRFRPFPRRLRRMKVVLSEIPRPPTSAKRERSQ
jgi:hypothetical protein